MASNTKPVGFPPYSDKQSRKRICDLPVEDQPLYRLRQLGSYALATSELLALVLATADAPGLAEELLASHGSLQELARTNQTMLQRFRGVGEVQAARLVAVLELCRRLQGPPADKPAFISSPGDAAKLFLPRLQHLQQEVLCVMLLNTRGRVINIHEVYKGSLNTSVIRIGELFRKAIEGAAASIIVAHNHPSGDAQPSAEDVAVTRQIIQAGKLLDIPCLDHIVIGNDFVSLKQRGLAFDK